MFDPPEPKVPSRPYPLRPRSPRSRTPYTAPMAHILILISDTADGATVTVEHAPKPAEELTPAQKVAASITTHLQTRFHAEEETDATDE